MSKRRAINFGVRRSVPASKPARPPLRRRVLWALEERWILLGDVAKASADALRWPFERVAWAVEARAVWPLRERAAGLSSPVRCAAAGAMAALALSAGVLGATLANDGGTAAEPKPLRAPAPVAALPDPGPASDPEPVLRGVAPDFTPEGAGTAKLDEGEAIAAARTQPGSSGSATASADAKAAPVGPAAREVAHEFASAFVLYETGRGDPEVERTFRRTATPQLARALLARPPRLPANARVPKAKVLNVVPGPAEDGVHTVSVSLLRVGLTSELRLDIQRDEESGRWKVTNVLG